MSSVYQITPTFLDSAIKGAREMAVQIAGETSFVSSVAIGICGIAMLWAFMSQILPAWSRNEPIDLWPLGRPVMVAILVGSFSGIVVQPLMFISNSITDASGVFVQRSAEETANRISKAEEYIQSKKQEEYNKNGYWSAVSKHQQFTTEANELYGLARSKSYIPEGSSVEKSGTSFLKNPSEWVSDKVNGILGGLWTGVWAILVSVLGEILFWLGMFLGYIAYTVIIIFQQIYLIILCLVGPLAFALSIFPAFQSGLYTWLAKFINVSLWGLIANILRVFTNQLRGLVPVGYSNFNPEDVSTHGLLSLLYVLVALCYFFIPTLADMIVQSGGGMGDISGSVSRNAKKASKWVARKIATSGVG